MSFNGIWVWDAKHGTPKNRDEVGAIKSQLMDVTENNPNMAKFSKFFGKFAEEAIEFYDDEAIRDYLGWGSKKMAEMPALHCFEELPLDCLDHFYGAILRGAKINNLVVYEANSGEITLPSTQGDQMYDNWQIHLKELRNTYNTPQKLDQ